MSLAYQGAREAYAYLPYSYASGAELATTTDQSMAEIASARNEGSSFSVDIPILKRSYVLQSAIAKAQNGASGSLEAYLSDEAAYRRFVEDSYLSIPSSTESTF